MIQAIILSLDMRREHDFRGSSLKKFFYYDPEANFLMGRENKLALVSFKEVGSNSDEVEHLIHSENIHEASKSLKAIRKNNGRGSDYLTIVLENEVNEVTLKELSLNQNSYNTIKGIVYGALGGGEWTRLEESTLFKTPSKLEQED